MRSLLVMAVVAWAKRSAKDWSKLDESKIEADWKSGDGAEELE